MNNQSFSDSSQTNSNKQPVAFSLNEGMPAVPNRSDNGTGKVAAQTSQISRNTSFKANSSNRLSFRSEGGKRTGNSTKRKVLSVSQILVRVNQKKQRKLEQKKRKKPLKPIIPPKSFILLFKDKPEKYVYNRRIIDYKHCGLLQRYIGLGGKILPRRQTKLTAKQQRYVAKTIKSARIMGLLPFVTKERSFFR
jgi:small subunit ribosomal protein S18